jgi:hypothetical protein
MDLKFDFYPKIILANTEATITIKPNKENDTFNDSIDYIINCYSYKRNVDKISQVVKPNNGIITFKQFFNDEQEHKIVVINSLSKEEHEFHFYSVEADLFYLNPYKGDLHMHSNQSDGLEPPEFVTAMCRKIGMDFMAITDHLNYQPSIYVQNYYKNYDIDMLIARGEEVHAPNNKVHIINYGGEYSINEFIKNNNELYYSEVNKIMVTLDEVIDEQSRYEIASSIWIFNKIRDAKGLAIFCHPYWLIYDGYYISEEVITFMLKHQPYDAYEVIGGYRPYEEDSNTLQIAHYHEECRQDKQIPIVGVSDAHGCFNQLFGWFYTIVFAKSNKLEDIIESIKSCYSVAVENIPNESIRPVGPFRLVKYALYLAREYFPLHDSLCSLEGDLMINYVDGNKKALNKIKDYQGQVDNLIKKIFNRNGELC